MGQVEFAGTIKKLRLGKRISLRKMAGMLGISPAYLSRIENGRELPPKGEHIVKLAGILDVPADELLRLAGRMDPEVERYVVATPLVPEFLRTASKKGLSSEQLGKLIDRVKKGDLE